MESLLTIDQKVLLTIKRIGINGEGIGYYKKQAVFVPGVLPPEEVIVKITDIKNNYSTGEIVAIKTRANKRTKPFCKHYGSCGGCQLQHIEYDEQLSLKEEMLIQTIGRYSDLNINDIKFNSIIPSENDRNYRYKAQMPVRNTKNGIMTGLFELNTNELVEIQDCPVHAKKINVINQQILEILDKYEINAFDPQTMRGLMRYIVTRVSHATDKVQVTLVVTIYNKALKSAAAEIIELLDVESVAISKNRDAKNIAIFGEEVEILEGSRAIQEGIDDVIYDLTPKAFYQLNPAQAIRLYQEVESHLDYEKDKIIFDAYCGSGAISMLVSKKAEKVVGIDASKESIYSARHNVKINNRKNIEFSIGEVKEVIPMYYQKRIIPDCIIIDPPRSGIDDETLQLFNSKVVKKLIYVSCNPSTLAKNLKVLSKRYKVESITPVDMFPHTSHIESVTVLKKK